MSISEIDPESPSRRDVLVIRVEEAPRTTVAYGIGYAERDLLRGSVEVTRRNLFGMDRSLSAFARISFRGQPLAGHLPRALPARPPAGAVRHRASARRRTATPSTSCATAAPLQTARALSRALEPDPALRPTSETRTFNVVEDCLARSTAQFRPATLSGPSASVVNDTRDDPLDPHRGRFLSADVQLSHARRSGGDSFVKAFVQASGYLPSASPRADARALRRAGAGPHLRPRRAVLPAPSRTASSPAATTACAASACDERAARRAGNARAPRQRGAARRRRARASRRPPSATWATSTRWSRDLDLARPALHGGRWGCATRARSAPCASTGASSSTGARTRAPYHVHFTIGHAF